MSTSSGKQVRPYSSYGPNELTTKQAMIHRNELRQQMDGLLEFGEQYINGDQKLFETLRIKFKAYQQEERLYRKFTDKLYSSKSKPHLSNQLSPQSNNILPDIPNDNNANSNNANNNNTNNNSINNNNNNTNNNNASSVVNYHSEEEKCDTLVANRGYPMNNNTNNNMYNNTNNMSRSTRPPFIDDNISNNNNNISNNNNNNNKMREEVYDNIAYLLFTEWPFTINQSDLYPKYFKYFRVPMELTDEQIENNNKKWIIKKKNDLPINESNSQEYWELCDVIGFFNNYKSDKQYACIREKICKRMNELHPYGLKADQFQKMFKYWIGLQVEDVNKNVLNDINASVFNKFTDNNNFKYIVLKENNNNNNNNKLIINGDINCSEPWKLYSLSVKHMLICILTEKNVNKMSITELQNEYKNYFGVELNMKSWFNQYNLTLLMDVNIYKNEKLIKVNKGQYDKHELWISWWAQNGPNNINGTNNGMNNNINMNNSMSNSINNNVNNNNEQIRNAEPYPSEYKEMNNNSNENRNVSSGGTGGGGYDPNKPYNQNYENKNYENSNRYDNKYQNNNNNNVGGYGGRGYQHPPAQLLYIGGLSTNTSEKDIQFILSEIEKEENVKFTNHYTPRLKGNFLGPVKIASLDGATRLIAKQRLVIKSFNDLPLFIRKWNVKQQNERWNNNNSYNGYQNDNNRRYDNGSRNYKSHRNRDGYY